MSQTDKHGSDSAICFHFILHNLYFSLAAERPAVGFIEWLDEKRSFLSVLSFFVACQYASPRFNILRNLLAAFLSKLLLFSVKITGKRIALRRSLIVSGSCTHHEPGESFGFVLLYSAPSI